MEDFIIFRNLEDKFITLPEYVEERKKAEGKRADERGQMQRDDTSENSEKAEADKEEEPTTVYYVTDMQQQSQYINMFKEQNIDAIILTAQH